MYIVDIFRRSGRSLLSAKTRTILTALAIAVGTFALTLTLGASNGARAYADGIIRDNFDPTELIVAADASLFNESDSSKPQTYDPNYGSFTNGAGAIAQIKRLGDSDIAKLRTIEGVESVRPGFTVSLQYLTRDGQKQYVGNLQAYNTYRKPTVLAGNIPATIPAKTVILPEGFVGPLGFKNPQEAIGQTVRLAVRKQADQTSVINALNQGGIEAANKQIQGSANNAVVEQPFKVIAVTEKSTAVQPGTELYLYSGQQDAVELNDLATNGTGNFHKYITAYVKVKDGTDETKLKSTEGKIEQVGYTAQSVQDTEKFITQIIQILQGIVSVFGLIAVVASVFGIVNTMYISVLQRTREIGLMKALGMHKRDISRLFRIEAAFIGLLGGLLGSVGAVALGTALNPWISEKLALGDDRLMQFDYLQIAVLILGLIIVATLSGLLPARKAARLDPIEALRVE